jgi:hypothetical protein
VASVETVVEGRAVVDDEVVDVDEGAATLVDVVTVEVVPVDSGVVGTADDVVATMVAADEVVAACFEPLQPAVAARSVAAVTASANALLIATPPFGGFSRWKAAKRCDAIEIA